ncbi:MAG: M20/M25/M40 family metallo-hydrolase [Solirubrobacteraceae bacterium]|nr:M20/M25/M40 family metallo-hydrolase [Solirubrobacteraceae bacterium]
MGRRHIHTFPNSEALCERSRCAWRRCVGNDTSVRRGRQWSSRARFGAPSGSVRGVSYPQPDPAGDEPLAREATALLQSLVRARTVNPPGDEAVVQQALAHHLQQAGFHVQLLEAVPGRPNLIAELGTPDHHHPGEPVDGKILTLLSHVDTVLADAGDWRRDPWGAEVVDGELWGRGAIDMKSQTAAEIAAGVGLARKGWRPRSGLLRIIVCVDEEVGGTLGARWLCEQHPALVRSDYVINEGGGAQLHVGDSRHYSIGVGEKGVCRFAVRARGRAAHASTPGVGDNALLHLVPVLERLRDSELPIDLTDAPRRLLEGLGLLTPERSADDAVLLLRERAPSLAPLIEPMLRVTAVPTMASASSKINVIPASAELRVDCRIPPGMTVDVARERVASLLEGLDVEVEFTETIPGNGSPPSGPVYEAIDAWLGANDPDAGASVPTILPGFTDSRWFRATFPDCQAYGFFPHRHMPLTQTYPLMHAADERIDLRDLHFATRAYRDLIRTLLG